MEAAGDDVDDNEADTQIHTNTHTHTETTNDVCGNATYANLLENAWQYFCVF